MLGSKAPDAGLGVATNANRADLLPTTSLAAHKRSGQCVQAQGDFGQ